MGEGEGDSVIGTGTLPTYADKADEGDEKSAVKIGTRL